MKTIISTLVLFLAFFSSIKGNEIAIPETEKENPELQSFAYGRLGAYTWLVLPIGVEGAIGYRFRSEGWGSGPMLNVSATSCLGVISLVPTISFKYEVLYYPKSWGHWYWGVMPSVGIGHGRYESRSKTKWEFIPSIEFVFGKEFLNFNNKKRFYYFSVNPLLVFSFNYGWSF
jgi:hypothetical protein